MPRICRPINPMEGRDYLTLDDRVRPVAVLHRRPLLPNQSLLGTTHSPSNASDVFNRNGFCHKDRYAYSDCEDACDDVHRSIRLNCISADQEHNTNQ